MTKTNKPQGRINDTVKVVIIAIVSVVLAMAIDISLKGNPFRTAKRYSVVYDSAVYEPHRVNHRKAKAVEADEEYTTSHDYAKPVTGIAVDNKGDSVAVDLRKEKVYGVTTVKTHPAENSYGVSVVDANVYGPNVRKYSYKEAEENNMVQTVYSYAETEPETDARMKTMQRVKEPSDVITQVAP